MPDVHFSKMVQVCCTTKTYKKTNPASFFHLTSRVVQTVIHREGRKQTQAKENRAEKDGAVYPKSSTEKQRYHTSSENQLLGQWCLQITRNGSSNKPQLAGKKKEMSYAASIQKRWRTVDYHDKVTPHGNIRSTCQYTSRDCLNKAFEGTASSTIFLP